MKLQMVLNEKYNTYAYTEKRILKIDLKMAELWTPEVGNGRTLIKFVFSILPKLLFMMKNHYYYRLGIISEYL